MSIFLGYILIMFCHSSMNFHHIIDHLFIFFQLWQTFCRPSTTSTDVSISWISFMPFSDLMSCQFWQSAILSLRPFLSRRTLERNTDTLVTSPLIDMHGRERAMGGEFRSTSNQTSWGFMRFFFLSPRTGLHFRSQQRLTSQSQGNYVLATNGEKIFIYLLCRSTVWMSWQNKWNMK